MADPGGPAKHTQSDGSFTQDVAGEDGEEGHVGEDEKVHKKGDQK